MNYSQIYQQLAEELNLSKETVRDVVEGYFRGIVNVCSKTPPQTTKPDDDFEPTVVNIKRLGRLVYERPQAMGSYIGYIRYDGNKEGDTDVHQDNNDLQ